MTRFALRHRAAEWFELSRKPREAWKTLDDLAAQLSEFELRCEGEDYDTAAAVLLDFDYDYLFLWGHYRLMIELPARLEGKITDPGLEENSIGNLGSAYYRMGQVQRAISSYEQALHLAQERNNRWGEGVWLGNLGNCMSALGQNARAIDYYKQALEIGREVGDRQGESRNLLNLGNRYAEIGQAARAIEHGQQALAIIRELGDREGEALVLCNLSERYMDLGQSVEALKCCKDALAIAQRIGYRFIEAASHVSMGGLHSSQDDWGEAAGELEKAIEIADEIGNIQVSKEAREDLALVNVHGNDLAGARDMVEAARRYDVPLSNHSTTAVLGIVALRQKDLNTAREAFTAALKEANELVALTADRYDALDVEGLSLCGLALCGDPVQIPAAKAAYKAARAVTSGAGITRAVLQLFDALAQADTDGILAEVRPIAAGEKD